jgi:hypothetical protein
MSTLRWQFSAKAQHHLSLVLRLIRMEPMPAQEWTTNFHIFRNKFYKLMKTLKATASAIPDPSVVLAEDYPNREILASQLRAQNRGLHQASEPSARENGNPWRFPD